jgi:hypothetical protein
MRVGMRRGAFIGLTGGLLTGPLMYWASFSVVPSERPRV